MAAEVFGRTCEHQEADLFGEFNEAVQFEDLEVRSLGVELNVDFLSEVLDFFERNVVFETEVFQKLIEIGRTDEYAFLCDLIKVLWDLAFLVSWVETKDELQSLLIGLEEPFEGGHVSVFFGLSGVVGDS